MRKFIVTEDQLRRGNLLAFSGSTPILNDRSIDGSPIEELVGPSEPETVTKIQLMTETPYRVVATYPFLYVPTNDSVLKVGGVEHKLQRVSDVIDEAGNLTRYVGYW